MTSELVWETQTSQLFEIDKGKKSWSALGQPKSTIAVHKSGGQYFVVCTEGSKQLARTEIIPSFKFKQTTPVFNQWGDDAASTMYGVGFDQEATSAEFAAEIDKAVKVVTSQKKSSAAEKSSTPKVAPKPASKPKKEASLQQQEQQNQAQQKQAQATAPATATSAPPPQPAQPVNTAVVDAPEVAALKYENERLQAAMSTNTQNAEQWEEQLRQLTNVNTRLKTALQESAKNVLQWKKQLALWKEENTRLKKLLKEKDEAAARTTSSDTEALSQLESRYQSVSAELEVLKQQAAVAKAEAQQEADAKKQAEAEVADLKQEVKRLKDEKTSFGELIEELKAWRTAYRERLEVLDSTMGELLEPWNNDTNEARC